MVNVSNIAIKLARFANLMEINFFVLSAMEL